MTKLVWISGASSGIGAAVARATPWAQARVTQPVAPSRRGRRPTPASPRQTSTASPERVRPAAGIESAPMNEELLCPPGSSDDAGCHDMSDLVATLDL
jgi:hypothetical protein